MKKFLFLLLLVIAASLGLYILSSAALKNDMTVGKGFSGIYRDSDNGRYWYENGDRKGTSKDPENIVTYDGPDGTKNIRGREIFDETVMAWYWLEADDNGRMAENREVWIPYIYQDRRDEGNGKWVRYDEDCRMIHGWWKDPDTGRNYYYDEITGAKTFGERNIGNVNYQFDETGAAQTPDLAVFEDARRYEGYELPASVTSVLDVVEAHAKQGGYALAYLMQDISSGKKVSYMSGEMMSVNDVIRVPYVIASGLLCEDSLQEKKAQLKNALYATPADTFESLHKRYGIQPLISLSKAASCEIAFEGDSIPVLSAEQTAALMNQTFTYMKTTWLGQVVRDSLKDTDSYIKDTLKDEVINFTLRDDGRANEAAIVLADKKPYILIILTNMRERSDDIIRLIKALDEAHGAEVR